MMKFEEKILMILPITAYGSPILKKRATEIDQTFRDLQRLIDDMWETLYNANGCGLAAPQINVSARLFLVDSKPVYQSMDDEDRLTYFDGDTGITETFINALIVDSSTKLWEDEEGCLSIPGLAEIVNRPWQITIQYLDREFRQHKKTFSGMTARMIQHEYDHIEGKLYLEYLSPLRKQLINSKLEKIKKGKVSCKYPLRFMKI